MLEDITAGEERVHLYDTDTRISVSNYLFNTISFSLPVMRTIEYDVKTKKLTLHITEECAQVLAEALSKIHCRKDPT